MGNFTNGLLPGFHERTARPGTTELTSELSTRVGLELAPREFTLADGMRIGVDCADGDPPTVLIQFSALHGQVKSTQRNKIIADALKLTWLRDHHFPDAHIALLLSTPYARLFGKGTWLTSAFSSYRITVLLVNEQHEIHPLDTSP